MVEFWGGKIIIYSAACPTLKKENQVSKGFHPKKIG